jgi:hypothetical protein
VSDPVKQYQDAVREYEKARLEASNKIRLIEDVSSALRHSLPVFLFRSYSLPTATRDSYQSSRGKVDMSAWPNSEALREILTKWHAAFKRLRETWGEIPESDRIGLQIPPEKMEPT